jgi:predicted PurR-regulated permease PerM
MASEPSGAPASAGPSTASRILIPLAAFVVVVAGLKAAAVIVVPFLMAVFLAVIAAPPLFWLKQKKISTGFAILIISMAILVAGFLVGTVLTTSIAKFTREMPAYEQKLQKWIDTLSDPNDFLDTIADQSPRDGASSGTPGKSSPPSEFRRKVRSHIRQFLSESQGSIRKYVQAGQIMRVMGDLLSQIGGILTNGFMIYLTTMFILLEASVLPAKIRAAMKNSPETYANLSNVADKVKHYLVLKTLISLATGILITIWLLILKVDYAILWGLIAFLLNFVPNIGSIIAGIPAVLLALLQLGPGTALLTALGYLVVNITIGSILEPRWMGQRLGLSTLVVFLSLIFWGWLLGPIGMLLSVPLTMLVKIILQSKEDTRWAAILLGSEIPPDPNKKK